MFTFKAAENDKFIIITFMQVRNVDGTNKAIHGQRNIGGNNIEAHRNLL